MLLQNPPVRGPYFLKTDIENDHGNQDASILLSQKALKLDPNDHAARLNLAHVLLAGGLEADALSVLDLVSPGSLLFPPAQVSKAEILYQVARRDNKPTEVLRQARECLAVAKAAVAGARLEPDDWKETRTHAAMCEAAILTLSGCGDEAVGVLESVEVPTRDRGLYLFTVGQAFAASGRWDEAVENLDEAYGLDPSNLDVGGWLGVGFVNKYLMRGDRGALRRAEEVFRSVLAQRHVGLVLLNLVQILLGTGRSLEARDVIQMARQAHPDDIEVMVAELFLHMRAQNADAAERTARAIYSRDPREVTAATYLGVVAFRDGHFEDALLKLQDAVSDPFCRSQQHVDAYIFLARTLKRLQRYADALDAALEAQRKYRGDARLSSLCEEVAGKSG